MRDFSLADYENFRDRVEVNTARITEARSPQYGPKTRQDKRQRAFAASRRTDQRKPPPITLSGSRRPE